MSSWVASGCRILRIVLRCHTLKRPSKNHYASTRQRHSELRTASAKMTLSKVKTDLPPLSTKQSSPVHTGISENHCCVYAGYRIPKGSIILPNIWAMSMNEKQYDHPERFNPGRYMGSSPALESPVFGFGRRACLGVHYSTAAIFITVSSILSVFELRAQDKDGKDVQIEPAFTGGMSSLCTGTVSSLYPVLLHFMTPGFSKKKKTISD